jgi:uncharacterized protein YjbJ (UPF0337 family)
MNWDTIQGNWKQLTGQVKSQWGKLTDGHREQLAGKIQERYGIAKDDAEKQLKDWEDRASDSWLK